VECEQPRGKHHRTLQTTAKDSGSDTRIHSGGCQMKINRRFSKTGSGQSHLHNAIFEPFMYKKDHFAKTGSGQT
jgi:hypothetical protein